MAPIANMEPDVEFADGTRTQMLAAEKNRLSLLISVMIKK
jgi:hypothetical protein